MTKNPVLIIVAGPNGSGKTVIAEAILKHEWAEDCEYVNPDKIARDKFSHLSYQESNLQAANVAEEIRENYLKNNKNLIFETVLSADDKIDFIKRAKKAGYFTRLFFIATDSPDINTARIAKRVTEGGHEVPPDKIKSRYFKSIKNCSLVCKIVDRAYLYDNSKELEEPKLLFRVSNEKVVKEYKKINSWALPVLKFIKTNK